MYVTKHICLINSFSHLKTSHNIPKSVGKIRSVSAAMMANTNEMSCNKSFAKSYMLLKPEEASLLDLSKILFSSDISKRKFVDCPEGDLTNEPIGRRWIIFISVLVQKMLLKMAKPMASTGVVVENWVNLLAENGGFFRLLFNFVRGKVKHLENTSPKFVSFTGHSDIRTTMSLSNGDKRNYYALLSVMASKASYENTAYIRSIVENTWKMDLLGSFDFWNDYQDKATTQAFVVDDKKDLIVVSFRGTEPFDADAWTSDFDISWYEIEGVGKVHGGFMKALGMLKSLGWPNDPPARDETQVTAYYGIRKLLKERLESNDKARFIVTGHSLGAAIAILFPTVLKMHEESWLLDRLEGIYTYGQPRVGDETYVKYMKDAFEKHNIHFYRFVYCFDLVPRLPCDNSTFLFKHFGRCIYYNSFYQGKEVEEEPDKNYFSLIWFIPQLVNACWEFIRGFIISFKHGPDYAEGGVMRMLRMTGLLVPGLPAHYFKDYVNATILASSHVFSESSSHVLKKD